MLENRIKLNFNDGWKFKLNNQPNFYKEDYNDEGFNDCLIPHDWSMEGPFVKDAPTTSRGGYRPAGIGCYRKTFFIEKEYKGSIVEVEFGGIFRKPTIYVNGKKVASWINGYTTHRVDVSSFLKYGAENLIAVKVDNSEQPNSRFFTGSGIYRDVNLYIKNPVYLTNLAPFVTTPIANTERAEISVETEVTNSSNKEVKFKVLNTISRLDGQEVLSFYSKEISLKANKTVKCKDKAVLLNPELWEPETPNLYYLTTKLINGKKCYDDSTIRFGIREIAYDKDKGFFLNGKFTKIKGVCLHHDNGALGAMSNVSADRRKLKFMKEMGCNAIRFSHNPMSEGLLDLCDEMGFMVMDEFFDEWELPKHIPYEEGCPNRVLIKDYYQYFNKCWKEDMRLTAIRDRNHPSIIMYSLGNEIPEQRYSVVDGELNAIKLGNYLKEFDDTRPNTAACCFDILSAENTNFCDVLDVAGYNYAEVLYDAHHDRFKTRAIIGTETTSVQPLWKRGEYHLDVLKDTHKRVDFALGEYVETGANRILSAEFSMRKHMNTDFIPGFFIWTGVDYLGEPSPHSWPSRSSYFGVMDTCCFPKDSYYFYKSFWSSEAVLHIFPHWNFEGKEGEMLQVLAYTNLKEVELFLNGKSQGKKVYDNNNGEHLYWDVKYEPGELKAVGYDKDGKEIVDTVYTAYEPNSIELSVDRNEIEANNIDLCYVTATVLDKFGHKVPNIPVEIEFVSDDLNVIAVDNGDQEYVGVLQSNKIPSFFGNALAIVSANKKGSFKITAKAKGLKANTVKVICK